MTIAIARLPPGFHNITATITDPDKYQGNVVTTAAEIKAAIDYCAANDLTCYVPESTVWRVDGTIVLHDADGGGNHKSPGMYSLVGEHHGRVPNPDTMPQFILDDTATGFDTVSNPKPFVHALSYAGTYPPAGVEHDEQFYGCWIRGIKIITRGRAGAHGLLFDAAQDCILEDIEVDGTAQGGHPGSHVGVAAFPGRCVQSRNLIIKGCQYGIRMLNTLDGVTRTSLGGGLINLQIDGATVVGIDNRGVRGSLYIEGLRIKMPSGIAITCSGGDNEQGNLHICDAIIDMATNNSVAISSTWANVKISRGYFRRCSVISRLNGTTVLAGSGTGVTEVTKHINAPTAMGSAGGMPVKRVLNGVFTNAAISEGVGNIAALPDEIVASKHYWRAPGFGDDDVIWTSDTTATAAVTPNATDTGTTNNTAALQAKINEAAADGKWLHVTKGYFRTNAKLIFPANLKIMGSGRKAAVIGPLDSWHTTINAGGVNVPIVETADDANGTLEMCYITFDYLSMPNGGSYLEMLWWKVGRKSKSYCNFGSIGPNGYFEKPAVTIRVIGPSPLRTGVWGTGHGGGKFVQNRIGGSSFLNQSIDPDQQRVVIDGVTEPLSMIGQGLEYGGAPYRAEHHNYMLSVLNSSGPVMLRGLKSEANDTWLEMVNSVVDVSLLANHKISTDTITLTYTGRMFDITGASSVAEMFAINSTDDASIIALVEAQQFLLEGTGISPKTPSQTQDVVLGYYHRTQGGALPAVDAWDTLYYIPPPPEPDPGLLAGAGSGTGYSLYTRDPAVAEYLARVEAAGGSVAPDRVRALTRLYKRLRRTDAFWALARLNLYLTDAFTGAEIPQLGTTADTLTGLSGTYAAQSGFTKAAATGQYVQTGFTPPENTPWGFGALLRFPVPISGTVAVGGLRGVAPTDGLAKNYRITGGSANDRINYEHGNASNVAPAIGSGTTGLLHSMHRFAPATLNAWRDGVYQGASGNGADAFAVPRDVWILSTNNEGAEQFAAPVNTRLFGYFITGSRLTPASSRALHDALLSFIAEIGRDRL